MPHYVLNWWGFWDKDWQYLIRLPGHRAEPGPTGIWVHQSE